MKLVLKLKLQTDRETDLLLRELTEQYRLVCCRLSKIAFENRVYSKFELQRIAYHSVKTEFNLPSQIVIRAIAEVCSAYKTLFAQIKEHNRMCEPQERREVTQIAFHAGLSVPYDERVLAFSIENKSVSLRLLHKRIRFDFQAGKSREHLLHYAGGQADLKRYGRKWFLFQTIDVPEVEPVQTTNHIGVDSGIAAVATAYDGKQTLRFDGERIRRMRTHRFELRRGLQRHNTKFSRKSVRKMRDKESRIVRAYNHLVSRRIVEQAKRTNSAIVLEDLDGLRAGAKVRKGQRRERFSWAYAQLISFIVYKAQLAGLSVQFVNPAYTSKTCSKCLYMHDANRQTQAWFKCRKCGFAWNADDNASINIRFLGAESTCHKRTVCMQDYLWTDRRKPLTSVMG